MSIPDPQHPEPDADASPEQLEADIARTREELGKTVEQLTSALDVKTQAKQQVGQATERARRQLDDVKDRAAQQFSAARYAVTDDDGQLNRNGWIAASVAGAGVALGIYLIIHAARR